MPAAKSNWALVFCWINRMPNIHQVRNVVLQPPRVVAPSGAAPVVTWRNSAQSDLTTATQSWSVDLGSAAALRYLILGLGGISLGTTITSLTITPNVGTAVTASQVAADAGGGSRRATIWSGVLLSDADSATTATVTLVYSTNPFGGTMLHFWTVPSGDMSSQTATGTGGVATAAATTTSTTVNTSANGFIVAVARSSVNPNATTSFTGSTETITQRNNSSTTGISTCSGDASGVAANASSSVVVNFGSSGTISLAAAAWR
jgi:hypothetical protein